MTDRYERRIEEIATAFVAGGKVGSDARAAIALLVREVVRSTTREVVERCAGVAAMYASEVRGRMYQAPVRGDARAIDAAEDVAYHIRSLLTTD